MMGFASNAQKDTENNEQSGNRKSFLATWSCLLCLITVIIIVVVAAAMVCSFQNMIKTQHGSIKHDLMNNRQRIEGLEKQVGQLQVGMDNCACASHEETTLSVLSRAVTVQWDAPQDELEDDERNRTARNGQMGDVISNDRGRNDANRSPKFLKSMLKYLTKKGRNNLLKPSTTGGVSPRKHVMKRSPSGTGLTEDDAVNESSVISLPVDHFHAPNRDAIQIDARDPVYKFWVASAWSTGYVQYDSYSGRFMPKISGLFWTRSQVSYTTKKPAVGFVVKEERSNATMTSCQDETGEVASWSLRRRCSTSTVLYMDSSERYYVLDMYPYSMDPDRSTVNGVARYTTMEFIYLGSGNVPPLRL